LVIDKISVMSTKAIKQKSGRDRASLQLEADKECILCGKCMEVCPVLSVTAKEELSPRAKYFLLQELTAGKQELSEDKVKDLAGICLKCGRCADVCPQGLNVPWAIIGLKSRSPGWKAWIWGRLVKNLQLVYPLLYGWKKISQKIGGSRYNSLIGSGYEEIIPRFRIGSLEPVGEQKRAVLFPGCLSRYGALSWKNRAEEIIKRAGYSLLDMPDWNCCGFAVSRAGLLEDAEEMQQDNLDLWRSLDRPYIFVLCTTCLKGLREMAKNDLDWQGEQSIWIGSLVPVSSLLKYSEFEMLNTDRSLYLHRPCHAENRDWSVWKEIGLFEHTDTKEVNQCCGFGGCLQLEKPEIPELIARNYWNSRTCSDNEGQLLTECSACIMQLDRFKSANVQVSHWLDAVEFT